MSPNSALTHEKILAAAEKLFKTQGIRASGVDAIAAEAGVTKVTLYKHFMSKDNLIAQVLRRWEMSWRDWFVKAVESQSDDPYERLLGVFTALEQWFAAPDFHGNLFMNAAIEVSDSTHPIHAVAQEHRANNRDFFRRLAEDAGLSSTEQVVEHMVLLFRGAIVSAVLDREARSASVAREAAEAIIARYANVSEKIA